MKIINEFKVNWNEKIASHKQFFAVHTGSDCLLIQHKELGLMPPSSTSIIISKLLIDSNNNEMMSRLKAKLGLTKEEINKIVSEL